MKLKLISDAIKNPNQKRQIVQSEDSDKTNKNDKSFLSDRDRNFDRETIARKVDIFNKAAKGNSRENQSLSNQLKKSSKNNVDFKNLKLSDVGLIHGDLNPKEFMKTPAINSKQGIKNGDALSRGLSATNDYVEEVKLGDFTNLNTVEYKYYGFFHRIRQKLEQFWGKSVKEKSEMIFRSGRRIASQDYVTSLQVTLNESGEIISVRVLGASGVRELDDAAVESFNQAGPFPNPPKGLLVNGKATIEWGFVVKS
jgi:protein TonB